MKEFIEKLIGRLEEEIEWAKSHGTEEMFRKGRISGFNTAKRICNELAEEYNNDFCEWTVVVSRLNSSERWIYYDKIGCTPNEKDCLSTFHFSEREQRNFLKYCPYCGKKIKVVE